MLCPTCRRQLAREDHRCPACGQAPGDPARPGDLVLGDGRRVPVVGTVSIGRAPGNTLRLPDPAVSRHHARVRMAAHGPVVEDAGSRRGTYLDDERVIEPRALRDGGRLRLGRTTVTFERRRRSDEAGLTAVVRNTAAPDARRPRLRPGTTVKRLAATEGDRRWVVANPSGTGALRLGDADAALLGLLDGRTTMTELAEAALRRFGPSGPLRLAQLVAALAERGLLSDAEPAAAGSGGRLARLLRPRERVLPWAGAATRRVYDHGGFLLFTRPVQGAMAAVAVTGLGAFLLLFAVGAPLPFRVAESYGLGGLVFIAGRLALVTLHELAHGLALTSYGRPLRRAGLKLVLIFPYAFVDTTDAWREPRRHRLAITGAGPASDLVAGGACGLAALALHGVGAQIAYQLALAAYLGAFYNLNPLLDRDGYQLLVDLLGEPNLRRRSRERLVGALAGTAPPTHRGRLLLGFGIAAWAWSLVGLALAAVAMARSIGVLSEIVPPAAAWSAFGVGCALLAAPALLVLARPLASRRAKRKERRR